MINSILNSLFCLKQFKTIFRSIFFLLCFCSVLLLLNISSNSVARAAVFIVNSTDDPGDGVCTSDHCTLHEAIASANANPGKDQISFNLLGSAPYLIQLTEVLPEISDPVVIDGSTQPGFIDAPIIELDGSLLSGGNGLEITGGDSLVRSLVVNGFRGPIDERKEAIYIHGEGGNKIQGCYLGTDVTGTLAVTNSEVFKNEENNFPGYGVFIYGSSNNLIGGNQPGEGNLISGNYGGIAISNSDNSIIQSNYIGIDKTGNNKIGNGLWFEYKGGAAYSDWIGIIIEFSDYGIVGGEQNNAGNVISGNYTGIYVVGSNNFQILGNKIGTNFDGTDSIRNRTGIELRSRFTDILGVNYIGGREDGAGNLISGNGIGISINFESRENGIRGIKIVGNKIGTNYSGLTSIPNGNGIEINFWEYPMDMSDITIGGDQPGEGNLISGNEEVGIRIGKGSGIRIQGNRIGTDITGSFGLGNSSGIAMSSADTGNLVGGETPGAGNLISGNDHYGILIQGNENRVYGNMIGTNSLGSIAIGNGLYGVTILDGEANQIGGTLPGEGNLISGNQHAGVLISGSASQLNSVQGNLIGTDLGGEGNLGNYIGVAINGGLFNLIGGYENGAENRIAFSNQLGVWIKSGYSNSIISNEIYGSTGLGIELGEDGVTPNDSGDVDTGANELQNFPILTSVESRVSGTTIVGELNSEAEMWYVLQFFSNENCNQSGHGEGESFLVSSSVLTDQSGYASFTIQLPDVIPEGNFLTATATSPTYDTSEFSACVPVEWVNSPPSADAGGPYSGAEGEPISLDGSRSSDPDGDPLNYSWSVNTPHCSFDKITSPTPTLTCIDNDSFTLTLVIDDGQASDSDTAEVTVSNIAPTVSAIVVDSTLVSVGTSINANTDFIDPGTADTHTAIWDWGDMAIDSVDPAASPITAGHAYDLAGVYEIMLTVTDDDGDSGTSTFQYVVVYDPDIGFVTGGGWIDSPAGAYVPDPLLTGIANFGLVSKYKKGASIPTGIAEFQFLAGDLNFHSSNYEWLVVNQGGTRAQFKGTGTINGIGSYKFMLWAGDDNPDTFRIKIWYEEGDIEVVVYDNGFESSGYENGQPIGGGNILVYTK